MPESSDDLPLWMRRLGIFWRIIVLASFGFGIASALAQDAALHLQHEAGEEIDRGRPSTTDRGGMLRVFLAVGRTEYEKTRGVKPASFFTGIRTSCVSVPIWVRV